MGMTMRRVDKRLANGEGVLITGCSSGIGRHAALALAGQGFTVFATVRREADAESLRDLNIPGLVLVRPVDLADPEDASQAAAFVAAELARRGKNGLYALINNAGAGRPMPVELLPLAEFHTELRARVLGSVALVQALLPLLRRAGGRIVWIMTPALIPTPYVAAIHACDFAVNCVARTLDIELKPWRIPNIMIRCGGIRTPAGLRTVSDVEAVLRDGPPDRVSLYEGALRKWAEDMAAFNEKRTEAAKVAEVIVRAVTAKKPKRRYSIGHMAKAAALLESLPQPVADRILRRRF
ncbi:MAG: SDR family NAD(P)-dependent oxidoreductase [Candidatus Aminicenantales bacterium]|jgi:NAD(P)-dependent dehydrogenase (short-subunit alcohol dehydrogenase family)